MKIPKSIKNYKLPPMLELLRKDSVAMPRMFSFEEVRKLVKQADYEAEQRERKIWLEQEQKIRNQIRDDLLKIAKNNELEELRREVERYFGKT